jgi:tetratricopeptide (TPR) repeat protein
LTIREK